MGNIFDVKHWVMVGESLKIIVSEGDSSFTVSIIMMSKKTSCSLYTPRRSNQGMREISYGERRHSTVNLPESL